MERGVGISFRTKYTQQIFVYEPVWLRSCFLFSGTRLVLLSSPTNHASCITCRCELALVRWCLSLCCWSEQRLFTVLSPLTSVDWYPPPPPDTHTPSLPHLMKIDLFCLDFHCTFSPQRFFTAMSAVYFLRVCPSHKRKGRRAAAPDNSRRSIQMLLKLAIDIPNADCLPT